LGGNLRSSQQVSQSMYRSARFFLDPSAQSQSHSVRAGSPVGRREGQSPEFRHGGRESNANFILADGFFPYMNDAAVLFFRGGPISQH